MTHLVVPSSSARTTPFELVAESIPHMVWVAGSDGSTEYFNQQGRDYTGLTVEQTSGWGWLNVVHPDDVRRTREAWVEATETGRRFEIEYRVRRFDGAFRWMTARALPMRVDGVTVRWVGTWTDIEDQRRSKDRLRKAQRDSTEALTLLETLQSTAPLAFSFTDRDMRLVRLNETLAALNGLVVEECLGRHLAEIGPTLWRRLEPIYREVLSTGEAITNIEVARDSADIPGEIRHWLASYYPVRVDGEVIGVGMIGVDVTEAKREHVFTTTIANTMAEGLYALDSEGRVTFVNDAAAEMLGWSEGDLRGKPMHEATHHHRADGSPISAEDCAVLKVATDGRTVRVTDDAFTRRDGSVFPVAYSASPLLDGSKVNGVVVVFRDTSEEMGERERMRRELDALTWIGRIREAMDEGRLVLYSQPIIPLTGGEPSQELLVRMIGRAGEIILPGSFVPIAERYGQITEIDRWAITNAIAVAARGHHVEVNVSAQTIATADLLPHIEQQLCHAGADPSNLVFEITETALMHDLKAGMAFAHRVAEIGCGLALDDFGTGFGSFTYLKKFPVRYLKIDVDFVRDLADNLGNQHLVRAIVNIAHGFGCKTIAEGVEDERALALLRNYGVDFAQGFLLGRPAPLEPRR
ncbi:MAG: EAL domain-containing protein [Acidimicrobiia bacterium]